VQPRLFAEARVGADTGSEGAGIGLYLLAELLRRQDGEVRVDSAPGRGSTFTLVLPRAG
jgi:signal transduction histidine kinase